MAKAKRSDNRSGKRMKVLVVTGSRSEFGLLRPVIEAIEARKELQLRVCVAGEHMVAGTLEEVERHCRVDHRVVMQKRSDRGRLDHAAAFARGVAGFAGVLKDEEPAWLVVLGDRIEAFAAASAAAVAGVAICHIHGGDRAEGIADEAMRHAISKLAQLHCAATKTSAARLVKMGEANARVHVTGSPAIDGLNLATPSAVAGRKSNAATTPPRAVVLLHPGGLGDAEAEVSSTLLVAVRTWMNGGDRAWAAVLLPNSDPGCEAIRETYTRVQRNLKGTDSQLLFIEKHMPRAMFITMLRDLRRTGGVLIGNSSAGLIEAAAIGVPVVNLGDRQAGRERGANVVQCDSLTVEGILGAIKRATRSVPKPDTRYGKGDAGVKIAALLARGASAFGGIGKRNAY